MNCTLPYWSRSDLGQVFLASDCTPTDVKLIKREDMFVASMRC